jgi:hypothetical protein
VQGYRSKNDLEAKRVRTEEGERRREREREREGKRVPSSLIPFVYPF